MNILEKQALKKCQKYLSLWGVPTETALDYEVGKGYIQSVNCEGIHLRQLKMIVTDVAMYLMGSEILDTVRIPYSDVSTTERWPDNQFYIRTDKGSQVIINCGPGKGRAATTIVENYVAAN